MEEDWSTAMERAIANDNDATTSETDEQKKPRARALPIVLPINAAVQVPEDANTTVPRQPKEKQKVHLKRAPTETTVNPFEENNVPAPLGANVHETRILPETLHHSDAGTSTIPHQMRYNNFCPRPASSLPTRIDGPHRNETEPVSALVASLYSSMSASRPPEALNYWPRTASVRRQGVILPNCMAPQHTRGTHMSDMWRSPVARSASHIANSFGLQETRLALAASQRMRSASGIPNSFGLHDSSLALAASQRMAFWNTSNSIGAPLSSPVHRSANHILEELLRGQEEPRPQNPVADAALAMRNAVGAASTEQQRPSVPTATQPTMPLRLPAILGHHRDSLLMNDHQAYLRQQIEVFEATQDDIYANTRGRNRRIHVGQVGIRCRHCAHIAPRQRQSSTAYFPATMGGLYQAAQNMSTNHIQCGRCSEMPESVKARFIELWPTKNTVSRAGRGYWEETARLLGLVDTDNGIAFQPNAGR